MTPSEIKEFIVKKKYFIGWEIGMFLQVIYPTILPWKPKRGGSSVPLPGGCEVAVNNRGWWFLISHTDDDINEVCEELSKMKSLGLGYMTNRRGPSPDDFLAHTVGGMTRT